MTKDGAYFFHPNLLHRTDLGRKINKYSFFNYDANEALHVSDDEKSLLRECAENIKSKYTQHIDKHSQGLILSNIEHLDLNIPPTLQSSSKQNQGNLPKNSGT